MSNRPMMEVARRTVLRLAAAAGASLMLAGCMSTGGGGTPEASVAAPTGPVTAEPLGNVVGQGNVKAALILPLTATGNAGNAAKSLRNAAELAIAEFNNPQVQLIVKDDGGTAQGAATAAQQAIQEGAEIILGPLFAHSTGAVGQAAKQAGIPVIAFSTDANVASRGVYLLSFLPQSDVERIVAHAVQNGRRSFVALLPDNAYGTVVQGAFQEAVSRHGGRVVGIERYPLDRLKMQEPIQRVAAAARQADAIFLPDAGDAVPTIVQSLAAQGVDVKRALLLGTGQWDDPRIMREPAMAGGLFAAPNSAGYQAFAQRYRAKFGADPVRTATLAYDAVLLVNALAQTQGSQRFSETVLTNPSGFQGVDGVFRFKADGTNDRGLAVLQVQPTGPRVVAPAPTSFTAGF